MARVLGTFMIIVVFLACAASHAIAEPTLFLGSASAQPGGTTTLDLSISGDTGTYAGINARIVFDTDKVQVTGLSSGSFTVDYGTSTVNGHSEATVIAYSDQNTFSGSSGVLLKFNLQVDANAQDGTYNVQFAPSDTNPLINAKHAISNGDGTVSVNHNVQEGSPTIETGGFVDTDNDGIDDNWEMTNFENLTTVNGTSDYDKDGVLDKDEYNNNSNPKLTTPMVVSITPSSGKNTIISTELTGSNFQDGATAKLIMSGKSDINAANVQVVSSTKISCEFNLGGAAAGMWDVQVTIPNGEKGMILKGFTINESGGVCTDDYEPNDDFNVAKGPLDADTDYQGKICDLADKDYFLITVNDADAISVQLDVPEGKNYDLYLYDSSHNEIAKSIKTAGKREFIIHGVSSGDYFLKVVGNGDFDEDQEYTLSWTRWLINPANGYFYKLHEGGDWEKCEQEATDKYGAHLVTINDGDEQNWLTDTFGGSARYWIGYTDKDEEGNWKWIDGETSSYTNWNTGEPNNSGGCEDYAIMIPDGKWGDLARLSQFALKKIHF